MTLSESLLSPSLPTPESMVVPLDATQVLSDLIAFPSVSNTSNEAISYHVAKILHSLHFQVERTEYVDPQGVLKCNLVAKRLPTQADSHLETHPDRGLAYFCHTDVVPADRWEGPGGDPFVMVHQNDRLYGRGSCDMKGSLAAMLQAISQLDASRQDAPLWIICTADEEVGFEGAQHLVRSSEAYRELVAHDPVAIIGEPTRLQVIHAHKGITGFEIRSRGHAAHSSTGQGLNANLAMVPMLQTLRELNRRCEQDSSLHNSDFDPPTLTFNFGFSDDAKAVNIVPDRSRAWACLRTMPGINGDELIQEARNRAEQLGLEFQLFPGGPPMNTSPDAECVQTLCQLSADVLGKETSQPDPPQRVCYGTDGCVLTELSQRMVCGPGDIAQAHTTAEFIEVEQLNLGVELYNNAVKQWCCPQDSR